MKQKSKQNILITGARGFLLSLALGVMFFSSGQVYAQTGSSNNGQCNPAVPSSCPSGLVCNPANNTCVNDLGLTSTGAACTLNNAAGGCPCSPTGNNCGAGLSCVIGSTGAPACQATGGSQGSSNNTGATTSSGSCSCPSVVIACTGSESSASTCASDGGTWQPTSGSSGQSSGPTGSCPTGLSMDKSSGLCLPPAQFNSGIASSSSLSSLIFSVIKLLLLFTASVAIFILVIGGYLYMSSGGNEEQAEKGKKTVTNFALGLFLIIMAYAIVTIIGNTLTDNKYVSGSSGGSSITNNGITTGPNP